MKTDILAIGDIVTDAFIRLKEAEVHCEINTVTCKLGLDFGAKIPYEYAEIAKAVGNSANAAVASARLGLNASLLAYVGDDENGELCVKELQKNNVDISNIRTEAGKNSNYHYVLWYAADRTILVRHEAFTYDLGQIEEPKWIYLSSLGSNSLPFHGQIADFLDAHPDTKLVFQPGTFQIKIGSEALSRIYKRTEMFFCNVEEAQMILNETSHDLPTLLRGISALGPRYTVITDQIKGAYAYDGTTMWYMPIYPGDAYERTGAGDAFASTIMSAVALGTPFEEALRWGPVNSASVIKYVGAQKGLLTREQLEDDLKKAPEDYHPQPLQ
jgi:ribokinase